MNNVKLILISLLLASGCAQPKTARIVMLSDLRFGMQIFEVREIYKEELTPIGFESRQDYDLIQYGGWFSYDGKESKLYKLTFELYPPVTKAQCQYIIAKNNITDPNKVANIYSAIGLRPSKLVQVILDEAALQREEINRHNALIREHNHQNSYSSEILKPNAYGPGVHMNKYGQPVQIKPDFGGVPGEMLQIKPDAYGPGIHMDQYGRPVREYPWP